MFGFFDIIISLVQTVVGFITTVIEMIMYIFGFILNGIIYAFACIVYLPSWVLPFVTAVIGFSVIMFIIGKGK